MIEPIRADLIERLDVAERLRDLDARPHLLRRSERVEEERSSEAARSAGP